MALLKFDLKSRRVNLQRVFPELGFFEREVAQPSVAVHFQEYEGMGVSKNQEPLLGSSCNKNHSDIVYQGLFQTLMLMTEQESFQHLLLAARPCDIPKRSQASKSNRELNPRYHTAESGLDALEHWACSSGGVQGALQFARRIL